MRKDRYNEQGLLSLEACIAVTLFIFMMLFLYSFFVVFEVRNEMGHVTLATANSMAFDAYENNMLGDSNTIGEIFYKFYGMLPVTSDFTNAELWYNNSTETDEYGVTRLTEEFKNAIKKRFIAYLTSGNPDKADEILKRYHVVNGKDGLDFSGSYVSGDKLYLSVKYEIEYEFKVFNLGNNKFEHKVCSKLWK